MCYTNKISFGIFTLSLLGLFLCRPYYEWHDVISPAFPMSISALLSAGYGLMNIIDYLCILIDEKRYKRIIDLKEWIDLQKK